MAVAAAMVVDLAAVVDPVDGNPVDRLHPINNIENIRRSEKIIIIADCFQDMEAIDSCFEP
ncbi:MAG: hypothetical protein GQ542_19375 [Desulforhopalus sp.]|nr:hypothetical protein [Desulforhopalus sp.]